MYGEKAILATEVRELESRLLSLSDERDKSLAILNEVFTSVHQVVHHTALICCHAMLN